MWKCDFCSKEAKYDGRTIFGYWANMCPDCFRLYGSIRYGIYSVLKDSKSEVTNEKQKESC